VGGNIGKYGRDGEWLNINGRACLGKYRADIGAILVKNDSFKVL
jgi:hypothetical protein